MHIIPVGLELMFYISMVRLGLWKAYLKICNNNSIWKHLTVRNPKKKKKKKYLSNYMLEMFLRKQSGKLLLLLWCWKIPPCESVSLLISISQLYFDQWFLSLVQVLKSFVISSTLFFCNLSLKPLQVSPRMLLFPHLGCCGNSLGLNNHQIYWSFL